MARFSAYRMVRRNKCTRALLVAALTGVVTAAAWQPASAVTRVERTFGAWVVNCADDEREKVCALQTRAITRDQKVAFIWRIRMLDKQLKSELIVPAGVSLQEGVRFSIGTASPVTAAYVTCGPRWCIADMPLDTAALNRIKGAQKASANFVTGAKRLVQIELDLSQFAKAYDYFFGQAAK
jgi:invasion protein IalB